MRHPPSTARLVGAAVLACLAAGCGDDTPTASLQPADEETRQASRQVALGTLQDQGVRVTLYGPQVLRVGYVPLRVALAEADGGDAVDTAQVRLVPLMTMATDTGTVRHSAPTEPPAGTRAEDGRFDTPVVFTMPGTWQVQVAFAGAAGRQGTVAFGVEVEAGDGLARVTADDGTVFYVALVQPVVAVVGLQDLELAVFTKATTMSFPPVSDLEIGVAPTMPSMGHGSPDNEAPHPVGAGHYLGRVNFIMTGQWRLDLTLQRDGATLATTTLDVLVE